MTKTKLPNAFTLVEILIVIVILGILSAIVIPQFTAASDDAKAKHAERLKQLAEQKAAATQPAPKTSCQCCEGYEHAKPLSQAPPAPRH